MKLNHLDLQVSDVQQSVRFFESAFGLQMQSNRQSPALAILSDGEGFTLVLQRRQNPAETYPEGFHLGFLLSDPDAVEAFHRHATGLGLDVSNVIVNNRGTLVYCRSADGYLVEVSCHRRRAPVVGSAAT